MLPLTTVEGNRSHPGSLGAADAFAQASVLSFYDPGRSQAVFTRGRISSWSSFLTEIERFRTAWVAGKGAGLRILTETITSPTLRKAGLALAFLCLASLAAGSPSARAGESSTRPAQLLDVGIDQRLNERVPLDLPFRDEEGRTVKLAEYFGKKPVVLSLVYYACPMLCTTAENGLLEAVKQFKFDAEGIRSSYCQLRSQRQTDEGGGEEIPVRRAVRPSRHRPGLALPDR